MNVTVKTIIADCIERENQLKRKGKARDNAAIDFLVGAAQALRRAGLTESSDSLNAVLFIVSIRGYAELLHIATNPGEDT